MPPHPGGVVEPYVTTGRAPKPLNVAFGICLSEGLVATLGTDDSTVRDPAPSRLDVPVDAPLLCNVTGRPDVDVVSAPNDLAVVLEPQFEDPFKKGQDAACAVGRSPHDDEFRRFGWPLSGVAFEHVRLPIRS